MLRIAVVCQGVPHPTRGASLVIYYTYIQGLLEAGFSVHLVILEPAPGGVAPDALAELVERLSARGSFTAAVVSGFPQVRHRLFGISVELSLANVVDEETKRHSPDLVLAFDWVAAAVTVGARAPRVVWLGDLQFETLYWHTRFSMDEGSRRYDRLLMLPLRVWQIERFYSRILRGTKVIVSSKSAETTLARLGNRSDYLPYAWPALSSDGVAHPIRGRPTFLFNGTLGALGSRAAFHTLFRELYPRLQAIFGPDEFGIVITGLGNLPEWVVKEIAAKPEIRFLGYVSDLAAIMATCTAFIAPIDVPVGNRTRILTCMAAGLPVVAHPYTALGNPLLRDGETCLLAADAAIFAEKIGQLCRDEAMARTLAYNARVAYLHSHAPGAANSALVTYLSQAASHVE